MLPSTNIVDRTIIRVAGLFGSRSKEVERFIKFFLVGIMGAVVDFTTLNLLQGNVLKPAQPHQSIKIAIATGISFCAAVMSNFIWNRYWTYPDSRSKSMIRQLIMFYGVNTAAMAFRLVFVAVTFIFFAHLGEDILIRLNLSGELTPEALNQLGTNIAQALAVLVAMFWNFAINRLWTYNDVQ
jgi:putative flippase GtrA